MTAIALKPATSTSAGSGSTGTTTLTYDKNGNLTTELGSATTTYSWDYRNRLTQATSSGATSTYAYDDQDNRIVLTEGSVTTFFPNTLYNTVTGATTTKNIYANNLLVATIENSGGSGGAGGGGASTSTPALIASAAAGGTASSVTTAAIDTTGANFLIVSLAFNTGATVNLTDSKGNIWTPLSSSTVTGTVSEQLYYVANASVGSGHTFSNTGTSNFSSICVAAFSGVATSSPFDKESGATSSASTIQTGSVTPGLNQELLVSGLGWNATRTLYPPTLDSSFTVSTSSDFLTGNHYGCSIGYLAQSNAGAVNPTWNLGSAQSNATRIATFKPLVTQSGGTGSNASTTIRYVANDNIAGSSVVMDSSGNVVEALDYYPYGGIRVDTKTNYGGARNKYAGTVYDALTGLNHMQARYQNSSRGQFMSEDPVFIGAPTTGPDRSSEPKFLLVRE
jgi:RHS repeat-associated protein